jgi:dipeptidyl aminopeptidase/acylaminoacyl peptidase
MMTTISPEDILKERIITDAQISPDGNSVAFTVGEAFKEEGRSMSKSNIWIADVETGSVRQLTTGSSTDYIPRWSPNGNALAFLSDRVENGKFQLYILPLDGGEAIQLTNVTGEVTRLAVSPSGMSRGEITRFVWSPSGKSIAFLMYDSETPEDSARKEESGGALEFEEQHKFGRIWTVETKSKETKKITKDYHVWEFDWSPDERNFVALIADEPYEWSWHIARIVIIPVETGDPKEIYSKWSKQFGGLTWSSDGNFVFFISATISDRPLIGGDLFRLDLNAHSEPVNLTRDRFGSVHGFHVVSNDKLLTYSINMTKSLFCLLNASSGQNEGKYDILSETETALARAGPRFSVDKIGEHVAMVREEVGAPPEVWCADIENDGFKWKQLTHLNDLLLQYGEVEGELLEWTSFDGLKIQGLAYYPSGVKREKLPLIVRAHGGPSACYGYRYEMEARFFCSHGYAVLLPNPRGSQGRGVKFLEMDKGNIEGDDLKDILSGVDYCVERGWADPQSLFLYGGSYGGYLAMWAVSQTDRFKAVVADFGISNMLSMHGGEWNSYWEVFVFDINPYSQPELYDKKSAIYYAKRIRTPTLIIHGREDPCVPVQQSYEFFRALKELGVESKLVVYPREGHGWQERKHKLDSYRRHLSWFEAHREKRVIAY